MNSPYEIIRVKSPSGFYVEVERYGEHHMGAETVELVPSAPVAGVDRFRSTNGWALYDAATDRMFVYDACLILEIDPHTLRCRHFNRPEGWYISGFLREGDGFRFRLYDGIGGREEQVITYEDIPWLEGPGAVGEGRFPSAYP